VGYGCWIMKFDVLSKFQPLMGRLERFVVFSNYD